MQTWSLRGNHILSPCPAVCAILTCQGFTKKWFIATDFNQLLISKAVSVKQNYVLEVNVLDVN